MTERTLSRLRDGAVGLMLFVLTLLLFAQAVRHPFTNYDDPSYVTQNRHVQSGLTPANIAWAFTTGHAANWHPLTWISHMLDCRMFGLNPAGHHATSIVIHALNAVLLFLVLARMTRAPWRSAAVAALFAAHPVHVESVVWIAERKDVLSTFLGLLAMGAYVRYSERPRLSRYALVLGLFVLGLMAKPMLVTLPFVFLLLDSWPLRRGDAEPKWSRLLVEKLPLIAVAAVACVVTFVVQRRGGAVMQLEVMPFGQRIANALVSYVRYLGKTFVPMDLSVYYPRPIASWNFFQVAAAGALLFAISTGVLDAARKRPYLAVGWFWFLGTLVPVIGIVQVGNQAMADRYTYIPLVGVFIMLVWGAAELFERMRGGKLVLAPLAIAVLAALAVVTTSQIRLWNDDLTLFRHALAVTTNNAFAHNNLGYALARTGKLEDAFNEFNEAVRIDPVCLDAYYNRGVVLTITGQYPEAIQQFQNALRLRPKYYDALYNLGAAYTALNRYDDAVNSFKDALAVDPDQADGHSSLAKIYSAQGKTSEAVAEFNEAVRLGPGDPDTLVQMAAALLVAGDRNSATEALTEALRLKPDHKEAAELLKKAQSSAASAPVAQ